MMLIGPYPIAIIDAARPVLSLPLAFYSCSSASSAPVNSKRCIEVLDLLD
jgi:hypothetical protein